MTSQRFYCNLCDSLLSGERSEVIEMDRFEMPLGQRSDRYRAWTECTNCGVGVQLFDRKTHDWIREIGEKYYQIDFGDESRLAEKYQQIISLDPINSDNSNRVGRILGVMLGTNKTLTPRRVRELTELKVLDFGSGMGVFEFELSKQCKEIGIDLSLVNIESDPWALSLLNKVSQYPVFLSLNDIPLDLLAELDLVSFNKVLEHIPRPLDFLKEFTQKLCSSTVVYIEVPSLRNRYEKPLNDNSLGSVHYNLYSAACLRELMSRVGLDVLWSDEILEPSGKLTSFVFAKLGV